MDATTNSSQQTPSSSQPPTPPNSIHDITLPPPTTTSTTASPDNESLPNNDNTTEQHKPTTTTGIDVNEAISILSSRARAKAKTKQRRQELNSTTPIPTTGDNGDESPATIITAEQRKMGQTIDLLRSQEWARLGDDDDNCGITEEESTTKKDTEPTTSSSQQQQSPLDTDTENQKKVLQRQTPSQLLQTLFQLQQERVLTYRQFDDGLDVVLQTGNLTQYPHLTMRVTAAFAVVSGSINEVANVFRLRQQQQDDDADNNNGGGGGDDGKEVVKWIEKLQGLEKVKLNYTAALHLEKIRGQNEVVEREIAFQNASTTTGGEEDRGGGVVGGKDRIVAKLLEESIVSLQGKVTGCVEGINEILEELRYAAADMDE